MKFGIVRVLGVLGAMSCVLAAPLACSPPVTILPVKEPDKCTQQIVGLSIMTSDRLNPQLGGQPRPVQMRIYQLKSDQRFINASFDEIWGPEDAKEWDKKVLQDDLVKVDEFPIYPSTRTEVKFERDESALWVFAVAKFRQPTGRSWYTEFELPPPPGKGECGMPECKGPGCDAGAKTPPNLNPKFSVWADRTRVETGEDHLDDEYPSGKIRELRLRGVSSSPKAAPTAAGGGRTQ
jgi:type VI secretion system protein VasD